LRYLSLVLQYNLNSSNFVVQREVITLKATLLTRLIHPKGGPKQREIVFPLVPSKNLC
jgi:hypothetical protein